MTRTKIVIIGAGPTGLMAGLLGLSVACQSNTYSVRSSISTPFALCFLAGRVILLLLHLRAWRHVPEARPTIAVYLGFTAASTALWAVSPR